MDFESIRALSTYIQQYGLLAPVIAFFLFVLQAALPVFPYIILASAGGILFGLKLGIFISWSGALTGACVAYWICRLLGYEWLNEKLQQRFAYDLSHLSPSAAFWTIIIARIIPVVPTPIINVAAALGGVSFPNFLLSSAIGKIPSAVLYTGLGLALFNAQDINTILCILAAFIVLILIIKYLAHRLSSKKTV